MVLSASVIVAEPRGRGSVVAEMITIGVLAFVALAASSRGMWR